MRWPIIFLFAASGAWAQTGSTNPMLDSSKVFYANAKQDILRSAEKMPEDKYAFKPVDTVRSFGQILAPLERQGHIPAISSTPHALWAGVRLLGLSGRAPGFGTLLSKA